MTDMLVASETGAAAESSSSSSVFFASSLLMDGRLFEFAESARYIFCPGSLLGSFEGVDVLVKLGYFLAEATSAKRDNKCLCMKLVFRRPYATLYMLCRYCCVDLSV